MTSKSNPTLLVTGAGGHLGRLVVEQLLADKAGHIVAGTRDPAKLADLAARGAEIGAVDFDKPDTLAKAFAGVDRLLLVSTDAVGTPGGRKRQHRAAIDAAVRAGVKHIIYTSASAARPSETDIVPDDHFWTEQALAASPIGWTVLRNNIYSHVLLMGLPHAVASGQLFTATGMAGRNYVTREDCARVAAAALASDFDGRRIVDVTGPAPVTQGEVAAIASELTGRQVRHVSVGVDDLKKGLVAGGLPQLYADVLAAFDMDAAVGYHAITTSVVKDWTGREPTSVRDVLAGARADLLAAA